MQEKPKIHEIKKASRAFPFALRSPNAILRDLKSNGKPISLLEVYLGHKSEGSKYSANMLAPIGGKFLPGETAIHSAYGKIMEETALVCSPIIEKDHSFFIIDDSFLFDIKNSDDPHRLVQFTLVPVINPDIVTGIFPIQEDSKVDRLVGMSIDELRLAIDRGYYEGNHGRFDLQGHMTTLEEASDITINKKNKTKRNSILLTTIERLSVFETKAKLYLYSKLSRISTEAGIDLSIFEQENNFDNEKHSKQKDSRLDDLITHIREKIGEPDFEKMFTSAYSAVLSELYMDYFRTKEEPYRNIALEHKNQGSGRDSEEVSNSLRLMKSAEEIKKRFLYGNFGTDILHFLPLYISQEQTLTGKSTRLINELSRYTRDLFRQSIVGLNVVNFERGKNESRKDYETKRIDALSVFMSSPDIFLEEKIKTINHVDNNLIRIMGETFGYSEDHVKKVWAMTSRFIPELAEETKFSDPQYHELYQFHEEINEVKNSSLGQALLYVLGIDQKDNGPNWKKIKFEALRKLSIFLKILLIEPTYADIVEKKPHPVDLAINNFFGPIVEKSTILLGQNGSTREMPISYRHGRYSRLFLIDEKPQKSLRSVIRKSFEEPIEEIVDIYSASIVLPNNAYSNYNFGGRKDIINEQAHEFKYFLEHNYHNWNVRILEDKNTYDNYEKAMSGHDFSEGGKRTGSMGDLIIRRKIKVKMTDPRTKKDYFYEMVFYPYESFSDQEHKTEKSLGLMAWKEKIEDDASYALKRILFPLRGALGLKSFYELLYPPSVYPELIEKMRKKSGRVFTFAHA